MSLPTHHEVQGWPRLISFTPEEAIWERKLECAWDDRDALILGIVSYPDNLYPYNDSGAAVVSVSSDPLPRNAAQKLNGNARLAKYDIETVIVRYSTRLYAPSAVIETLDPYLEFEQASGDALYFKVEGQWVPVGAGSNRLHVGQDYRVKYINKTLIPNDWEVYTGTINAGVMTTKTLGLSFAAGTVLYRGLRLSRTTTIEGAHRFTAELGFTFQPRMNRAGAALGWNARWNPLTGDYEYVYRAGDNTPVAQFVSGSFSF
jgi:hypothetical protein